MYFYVYIICRNSESSKIPQKSERSLRYNDSSLPQSPSFDSILSITPSTDEEFKKVAMKPKRLSLSMDDLSIEEDEVMTANRRFRLRNRRTVSRMLQDGANHQVWTPGITGPTKESVQVHTFLYISCSFC